MSLAARAFLGAGGVQFSIIAGGIAQGYGALRETSKFEIKPDSEIKTVTSKSKTTYGQSLASVGIAKETTLSIDLREADYENLKLAFMGTDGVGINQAAATVTDEVVIMKIGIFSQLANRNLASVGFVLTDTAATTTYVRGVDYEVIYLTGLVRALEGGAITNLQSCKVDYTAVAMTSKKIMGSTKTGVRVSVLFTGKNLVDDANVLCTCHEVFLTPQNAFDLLADDFGTITVSGSLSVPLGKDSPYELDFLTV